MIGHCVLNIDELLTLALKGDRRAENFLFEQLSLRFARLANLNGIGNQQDIEDLTQKALVTIAGEYKTIKIEKNFLRWTDRVMVLKMWNHFTKQRRWRKVQLPLGDNIDIPDPSTSGVDSDMSRLIRRCFGLVVGAEELYSGVLALSYEGFNAPEISEKMKIKSNYCYYLLSVARQKIEECLKRGGVT